MDFIVSKIANEATRVGKPLSTIERQMLFVSESVPGAGQFADVAEAFDREYDRKKYERRIRHLIRGARRRADKSRAAAWRSSVQRLKASDRYVSVMLKTGRDGSPDLSWRGVVAVLMLLVGYVLFQVGLGAYLGHTPARDERAFYMWLSAVVAVAGYMLLRWALGSKRVDEFVDRVIDGMFKAPGK
jgi:hypothetical protein